MFSAALLIDHLAAQCTHLLPTVQLNKCLSNTKKPSKFAYSEHGEKTEATANVPIGCGRPSLGAVRGGRYRRGGDGTSGERGKREERCEALRDSSKAWVKDYIFGARRESESDGKCTNWLWAAIVGRGARGLVSAGRGWNERRTGETRRAV
jgi:hypothetical protein